MMSLPSSRRVALGRWARQASAAAALLLAVAATLALSVSGASAQCAANTGANSATGSGFVAGGQLGYNWQQGSWVYGVETDLSGSGLKSSMTGGLSTAIPCGDSAATTANVDWYGTVRGRAGWAVDKVLFYGTAGLAYGKVDLSSIYSSAGATVNASTSSTRAGWVVGAGAEYWLQPNLALTLGYQYVDLGTLSLSATSGGLTEAASAHAAFHVVTVGLNWRFYPDAAMAGKPWEGAYIGGHAGGAWGLDTDATYSAIAVSDARLKRDIALVGRRADGLGLYRYRYLWSDTVYVGVMAQEVALIHPDAVVRGPLDNYLRVNYARLGLHLMTWPQWQAQGEGERI